MSSIVARSEVITGMMQAHAAATVWQPSRGSSLSRPRRLMTLLPVELSPYSRSVSATNSYHYNFSSLSESSLHYDLPLASGECGT